MTADLDIKECGTCRRRFTTEQDYLINTSRWRICSSGHLWFNCGCGSTLLIKRGRFPWYSPDFALGPESRGVFNRLSNLKDLPRVPNVALELHQILQQPQVSPRDIARSIRKEPVLASQVLHMAETIRNARSPSAVKFKTLEHAVVYIGYKALQDLLVTASLQTIPLPESGFQPAAFWQEAYLTGAIAEALMRRFSPDLGQDEVFLAGSLCNLGKLVTAFCFPPLVTKIINDVSGTKEPLVTWRQAEAAYQFPDHCILGEIAATLWGFPVEIVQAIREHHTFQPLSKAPLTVGEIVAIANQMLHWVLLRPHRMEYGLIELFAARVAINESELARLAGEFTKLAANIVASTEHLSQAS
ncbi:MAG: HDOD domain-containing protein [Proteobacteria bacterium]|nr:HDOD domain-containing protein [Pseudomonadota bacterium]